MANKILIFCICNFFVLSLSIGIRTVTAAVPICHGCDPMDYPVCATNGTTNKTFRSYCEMETYNCRNQGDTAFGTCNYTTLHNGPCVNTSTNCDDIACTDDYSPVCSSNGKENRTFSNKCQMDVFNCQNNEAFRVLFDEACEPSKICYECISNYDPLCGVRNGTDKRTFNNRCLWMNNNECYSTGEAPYEIMHNGTCDCTGCPENCNDLVFYNVPACGKSENGTIWQFKNNCSMVDYNCKNSDQYTEVPCNNTSSD